MSSGYLRYLIEGDSNDMNGNGNGNGYYSHDIPNEMDRVRFDINPYSFQELEITCHFRLPFDNNNNNNPYIKNYSSTTTRSVAEEEDDEDDGTAIAVFKDDNGNDVNAIHTNSMRTGYDPLNSIMDVLITCWDLDQNQSYMVENDSNMNLNTINTINNNNSSFFAFRNIPTNTQNRIHTSPYNESSSIYRSPHHSLANEKLLLLKEQRHQFVPKNNLWIVQFSLTLTSFQEYNNYNNNNKKQNNCRSYENNLERCIMVQIQMFSAHCIYQHCFELKSNMSTILHWTINHVAKKQWQMEDIPLDVWDTIQEYVPICFWTHGEPSLVINEVDGQLDHMLTLPHGMLSTDWVWREGFFIENTFPKKIIRCAVKCETCEDFEGVFIPTEIRPRPNTSCMVWIDDDGESSDENYNEYYEKEEGEEWSNNETSSMYGSVYESSHSPYMCCVGSPPYHPSYMNSNNNNGATYMHMANLTPSFNHCGNLSDSDSTVPDDIITPPPLSLGGPLLMSNILENRQNENYDINHNWEYQYPPPYHTNTKSMPLTHANPYTNSVSHHNDYWSNCMQTSLPAQGMFPITCTTHTEGSNYHLQWPYMHTIVPTTIMPIPKSTHR